MGLTFSILLLLIACWGTGSFVPMCALLLALDLLWSSMGFQAGYVEYVLLASFLAVLPLSSYLTASLLDFHCLKSVEGRCLSPLAISLAFVLLISSGALAGLIESSLNIASSAHAVGLQISLLLSIISTSIFCVSLVGVCLVLILTMIELPVIWISNASGIKLELSFAAMRSLVLVLLLSLSLNLIVSLFARELQPGSLLELARKSYG